MVHKATTGNGSGGRDYEVGKGKPPKHTRFEDGVSGNPHGRPPGVRNVATDYRLNPITVLKSYQQLVDAYIK